MEWISVKDRYPDKEGDYLVCVSILSMRPRNIIRIAFGKPNNITKFCWESLSGTSKVTHWMPLPELPTEEK